MSWDSNAQSQPWQLYALSKGLSGTVIQYITLKSILLIMFANLKLVLRSYTSFYGIFMGASLTLFSYTMCHTLLKTLRIKMYSIIPYLLYQHKMFEWEYLSEWTGLTKLKSRNMVVFYKHKTPNWYQIDHLVLNHRCHSNAFAALIHNVWVYICRRNSILKPLSLLDTSVLTFQWDFCNMQYT